MKTAVLLYGHVRTFEQCWESLIKNVVDVNSCDVFIHTWDEIDHQTRSWYGVAEAAPLALSEEQRRAIVARYAPKGILIEHQPPYPDEKEFTFLVEKFCPTVSTASVHYIFYSMNQANLLRKRYEEQQGLSYDIVLVTRPDIAFFTPLDIKEILWQAETVNIDLSNARFSAYVHTSNQHHQKILASRVNDLIFFGVPTVIDRFIAANIDLSYRFIAEHALNYCAIYLAAELSVGIVPFQIAYCYKQDWKNIPPEYRKTGGAPCADGGQSNLPRQSVGALQSAAKRIAKMLLFPLKKFYQWSKIHLPWITQD